MTANHNLATVSHVGTTATDIRKRWGANVRSLREARGMNQIELAAAAGSSQPAISRIELGKQDPPLELALAITEALGTTYNDLFGAGEGD